MCMEIIVKVYWLLIRALEKAKSFKDLLEEHSLIGKNL